MKVYFVSGLAADSRVFKNIQLPEHCEPVFLEWITPLKKETLPSYALRLAEHIDTSERFGIIGLSMGGMIATEIARVYKPAFVVLISSIPGAAQIPYYMRAAGVLKLHKLLPVSLVKSAALLKRRFTTESADDKTTLRAIIRESDAIFIQWAMDAILQWNGLPLSLPYVHIHGTRDEILPMRFTNPTHTIDKGGHLMVMNRAGEINAILQTVLQEKV